jgi:uncharacterized membrane protein YhaH (DUF805 family)
MDRMLRFLFSVYGRIGRGSYWLGKLAIVGICLVIFGLGELMTGASGGAEAAYQSIMTLGIVFLLVSIPVWVAVGTKRLHDRNKRGWWLLLFYVLPLVGYWFATARQEPVMVAAVASLLPFVWGTIELGLLKGTSGPNRFGPDPLAG